MMQEILEVLRSIEVRQDQMQKSQDQMQKRQDQMDKKLDLLLDGKTV